MKRKQPSLPGVISLIGITLMIPLLPLRAEDTVGSSEIPTQKNENGADNREDTSPLRLLLSTGPAAMEGGWYQLEEDRRNLAPLLQQGNGNPLLFLPSGSWSPLPMVMAKGGLEYRYLERIRAGLFFTALVPEKKMPWNSIPNGLSGGLSRSDQLLIPGNSLHRDSLTSFSRTGVQVQGAYYQPLTRWLRLGPTLQWEKREEKQTGESYTFPLPSSDPSDGSTWGTPFSSSSSILEMEKRSGGLGVEILASERFLVQMEYDRISLAQEVQSMTLGPAPGEPNRIFLGEFGSGHGTGFRASLGLEFQIAPQLTMGLELEREELVQAYDPFPAIRIDLEESNLTISPSLDLVPALKKRTGRTDSLFLKLVFHPLI